MFFVLNLHGHVLLSPRLAVFVSVQTDLLPALPFCDAG